MKNKNLYLVTVGVLAIAFVTSTPAFASISGRLASQPTSYNTTNIQSTESSKTENSNINSINTGNEDTFSTEVQSSQVADEQSLVLATVSGNEQTINTKHDPYSYPNIVVQKGVPVKWTINADSASLRSCNSYMVLPSLKMQGQLQKGDNVIQFTPTETGTFEYYCSMQMFVGTITVVDDINKYDKTAVQNEVNSKVTTSGGGGCCGR